MNAESLRIFIIIRLIFYISIVANLTQCLNYSLKEKITVIRWNSINERKVTVSLFRIYLKATANS